MDTYIRIKNSKCKECLKCIYACEKEGEDILVWTGYGVDKSYFHDYVPCHHCNDHFKKTPPCQIVYRTGAIKITRC